MPHSVLDLLLEMLVFFAAESPKRRYLPWQCVGVVSI
jgi:hypothetical protein